MAAHLHAIRHIRYAQWAAYVRPGDKSHAMRSLADTAGEHLQATSVDVFVPGFDPVGNLSGWMAELNSQCSGSWKEPSSM